MRWIVRIVAALVIIIAVLAAIGLVFLPRTVSVSRSIVIDAPASSADMVIGDSVAVNGVCLTAVAIDGARVTIEAVSETLDRTNIGALASGHRVDLERPLAANGRFDGHIVQGHVDGVGTVRSRTSEGEAERVRIAVPADLAAYLVEKGSITVDGVTLTVTDVSPSGDPDAWFEIVLIPHTLDVTVLGARRPGDKVNLEVDVIAKYIARYMEHTSTSSNGATASNGSAATSGSTASRVDNGERSTTDV